MLGIIKKQRPYQVFAIFVITVAAAEAAVGLAILLSLYRNRVTVDMESFNLLKW